MHKSFYVKSQHGNPIAIYNCLIYPYGLCRVSLFYFLHAKLSTYYITKLKASESNFNTNLCKYSGTLSMSSKALSVNY